MVTLTGGIFLVAFALQMGATNAEIGLLAAIPPLGALVQLPAVKLIDRVRNRRLICVVTSSSSRFLWVIIALIPFLLAENRVPAFIGILALYALISSVGHCSWSSWMRDLVPRDVLGSFFSRRMALSIALGILLALAAGVFIDRWGSTLSGGYPLVFLAGFAAGLTGVFFLARIPEPVMQTERHLPLQALLSKAWTDANFKNLIIFLGLWNFAVNLAAPFFTVYLIKNIGLGMGAVISLAVTSQAVSVLSLPLWGRIADRYSNKFVLRFTGPLFMFCILGWTFTTMPERYDLTIPLLVVLHVAMGISIAGVTLATGNIGMKLSSPKDATAQLAVLSVVNSLVAGAAPILGGFLVDLFAANQLEWVLVWRGRSSTLMFPTFSLQSWDFFFFLSFLIGIYTIHRLAYVHEDGEQHRPGVIPELLGQVRREMCNLSTVGGLRYMLHIPLIAAQEQGPACRPDGPDTHP
jgi:MFS family permease